MLVLVPTTALADNDVDAKLVVEIPDATNTLFQYGSGATPFKWTSASLIVKLYDNTPTHTGGTVLPNMGSAVSNTVGAEAYVLYMNDKIYTPGSEYVFQASDLGKKTLTVSYTYVPTGHTDSVTVTKEVTISVQNNLLSSLTVTGPSQLDYYVGEILNLAGLTVNAVYTNMIDEKVLASTDYVVTASSDADGKLDVISATDPLTIKQKYIIISRTETYDGAADDDYVKKIAAIELKDGAFSGVHESAASLSLDKETLNLVIGNSDTVKATPKDSASADLSTACLVVSVDKPAIAAIESFSAGTLTIKGLSVGQAVVTIRTRGSNVSKTVIVNVTKPNTPVSALVLDKTSLNLPVNGTYSLAATVGPDDATDKTLTWKSTSPNDVSVDSTGTVKVLRNFDTAVTITATTVSVPAITASCSVTVNTVAVDGISLSDTSITLYKGSWKTISAVVTPSGAADPAVTWTSSAPSVATVDSTGKITAVGVPTDKEYGEATITAQTSNSSVKATITVKVLPAVLITSLTLNKSDLALNVGDEETLTVTGTPSTATNKTINWSSSNKDVASVSSSGKIIAASKGTAVIKAEATDGSGKYASCVVTVNNIQVLNVYLDKSSFDLSEGDTATVKATIYPTNATNQAIKWTSSNTSVATVDSKGNITAGATKGYSIITAAATDGSGKYAECVVLSKPKISVTGITINYGASLDLLVSDSTYLKATILPANATTQTATWTSSNASVASIDANGLLKGLTLGEATITATADGKTASIKITVTNTEYNYGVAANFHRRVNVRANASGLSKLVGYAYVGDTFKILGKTGSWYYIQYNNTTKGYIWASYLNATKTSASYTSAGSATSTGTTSSPGTTSTPTKATITNCLYAVNVRASASTTSTRIGKATLGSTYTYLATEGDWIKVQYNTTTIGYIFSTFISLS